MKLDAAMAFVAIAHACEAFRDVRTPGQVGEEARRDMVAACARARMRTRGAKPGRGAWTGGLIACERAPQFAYGSLPGMDGMWRGRVLA